MANRPESRSEGERRRHELGALAQSYVPDSVADLLEREKRFRSSHRGDASRRLRAGSRWDRIRRGALAAWPLALLGVAAVAAALGDWQLAGYALVALFAVPAFLAVVLGAAYTYGRRRRR